VDIIQVDPTTPDPAVMRQAAAVLRAGGLVAFPTETVYGLGANALDPHAVQRVFDAKGRPAHNPLIAHVGHAEAAKRLVRVWPDTADRLATAFWPGPLTLVLPRHENVPDLVSAGLPDIAVRVPDHPVALALLHAADVPIVAPSANPSGTLSPTRAEHVARNLGDRIQLILDAGPTRFGIESTVIDLAHHPPRLLRPGALPADAIETITGPLDRPARGPDAPRLASPGLLEKHYAPRARLLPFRPEERDDALAAARQAARAGQTVGALLLHPLDNTVEHPVLMSQESHTYARSLYDELHRLDDLGCDLVLVEAVPDGTAWDGVRDRLQRAAATRDVTPG
jgi:L-threonylcarbamoyladenylate synthase